MENKARYLFVGMGVILLTLTFTACLLWYSRGTSQTNMTPFAIYFKKHSLSGLQVGSSVTMRGIKIGRVEKVTIPEDQDGSVRVQIYTEKEVPVSRRTRAVVERNVLTGLASIELQTVKESTDALRPQGERLAVIIEGQGELEMIRSSLSETIKNLNTTLIGIRAIFTDKNQQTFASMLQNVEKITSSLADESGNIGKLHNSISEVLAQSDKLLHEVTLKFARLTSSLQNTSDTIAREANSVSQSMRLAADGLRNTMEKYKDPRKIILGPKETELGPGEK